MNVSDLRPIGSLAHNYGAKVALYGGPGSAKTPAGANIARACVAVAETGLESAKAYSTPAYELYDPAAPTDPVKAYNRIKGFFSWWLGPPSNTSQFDTLVLDSLSQISRIFLKYAQPKTTHGQQAYGLCQEETVKLIMSLLYQPRKNIIFICQLDTEERTITQGQNKASAKYHQPFFPGQKLMSEALHQIGTILYAHTTYIPGVGETVPFATRNSTTYLARDRASKLDPLEPPDLNQILQKLNS